MERDIFDDMIKRVECSYVSDLRYNKKGKCSTFGGVKRKAS